MDQNPYRILSCLCLTFTPVFPPLRYLRAGVGVLHLKSIMETTVYCVGMSGTPYYPVHECQGHTCLTLMVLHDSA